MSARIVQIDLAAPLPAVRFDHARQTLLLLVKFGLQPLGWVRCDANRFGGSIRPHVLAQVISQSLSLQVHDVARQRKFEPRKVAWMSFSIVVCTHENPAGLGRLLASLSALNYRDFETIVVDNAPKTAATQRVCEQFDFIRRVVEPRRGFAYARNTGWQVAGNGIVAYLDHNTVADASLLLALADDYIDPSVHCAFGDTWPARLDRVASRRFERSSFDHDFERRVFATGAWNAAFARHYADFNANAAFAIRRSTLENLDGFDPALAGSAAWCDMITRVLRSGGGVVHDPRAIAFSQIRQTRRALRRDAYHRSFNYAALCGKYFHDPELANLSLVSFRRRVCGAIKSFDLVSFIGSMFGVRSYRRSRRRVRNDAVRFVQKGIVKKAA